MFEYVPLVGLAGTATRTLTTQLPFAATVPLENAIDVAPATGAKVGVPQPDVEYVAGFATTICPPDRSGSGSVKFAPPIVAPVGLAIVKVSVDVPPATVGVGRNAFEKSSAAGSAMLTIRAPAAKSAL